jgi:hypothetical protein
VHIYTRHPQISASHAALRIASRTGFCSGLIAPVRSRRSKSTNSFSASRSFSSALISGAFAAASACATPVIGLIVGPTVGAVPPPPLPPGADRMPFAYSSPATLPYPTRLESTAAARRQHVPGPDEGDGRTVRVCGGVEQLADAVLRACVIHTREEAQAASKRVRPRLERARARAAVEVRGPQPVPDARPRPRVRTAQAREHARERRKCVVEPASADRLVVGVDGAGEVVRERAVERAAERLERVAGRGRARGLAPGERRPRAVEARRRLAALLRGLVEPLRKERGRRGYRDQRVYDVRQRRCERCGRGRCECAEQAEQRRQDPVKPLVPDILGRGGYGRCDRRADLLRGRDLGDNEFLVREGHTR